MENYLRIFPAKRTKHTLVTFLRRRMHSLLQVQQMSSFLTPLTIFLRFNSSKPHGHQVYRQFNIQKFYVLPTQLYLCVLCRSENKQELFIYTKGKALFHSMFPDFRQIIVLSEGSQVSPVCLSAKSKVQMTMGMEQWWNDTDRGKLKYWEKNIIQCGWQMDG